jgi:hypothetical protein
MNIISGWRISTEIDFRVILKLILIDELVNVHSEVVLFGIESSDVNSEYGHVFGLHEMGINLPVN